MDLDGGSSHSVVADGLSLVECMEHRGTTGAEENTGDGAGIMLQIPHAFYAETLPFELPAPGEYAVGSLFLPPDQESREHLVGLVEQELAAEGFEVLGWRSVPTDNGALGATAVESEPDVWQLFVTGPDEAVDGSESRAAGEDVTAFDRRLYVARRALENAVERREPKGSERFHVVSLSRKTVVYKGLLTAGQLGAYYPDLRDERMQSTFALVHARFSTNTLGAWHLAHPYRRIIHNGEFNTIQGNINWMRARETDIEHPDIEHPAFGGESEGSRNVSGQQPRTDIEKITPIINDPEQSDTASVDNALELLMLGGRSLPHALRTLIPEAWRGEANGVTGQRREFYDYHASLVEPWDGPALVAATDGERVGAVLDRNGLRPCRYDVLEDNTLVMASEAGALDYDESEIRERGRLRPGQCFLADPTEGRIVPDEEVFEDLVDPKYGDWVDQEQRRLSEVSPSGDSTPKNETDTLRAHQAAYGYTFDEVDHLLEPMAEKGKDPIGSMGDDTPLSVLSQFNRPLFTYFKQLFAQVSNPPLDYIREELVTSLETRLGHQRNLLGETPEHARQLVLDSPVLTDQETADIRALDSDISTGVVDITYDPDERDLAGAVERVRADASAAATDHDIVVLSDRSAGPDQVAVPSLLATGGVHHHLVRNGQRNHVGLVVESGDPRAVHHVATLVGYGAGAVNPYLAYQTITDLVAGPDGADPGRAIDAYIEAVEDGLLKTMAKMGISTVESYRGAQIFEAVGLSSSFVAEYFEGTENRTEGIGIEEIESDLLARHDHAWGEDGDIERVGEYENRTGGIYHQWNPGTVSTLQQAVRTGDYEQYCEFAQLVNDQSEQLATLRGLLEFDRESRESVPLAEVEPVADIVERFETAAMSLGSLSPEMHENNAIAMNRLGASANTGEGGEPPERFGTEKECATKQVASGRFGVTSTYLSSADRIQIKMAQGSKPGEGGHLPGKKVNEMIAHVRYATPGVGLISPPPLHDIYSIEDLKQLIHDLKAANPEGDVNVKLVAEDGVGIIAAGCAKANADVVHISGHSGGTGASPRTSIKNAGVPWELGLAEAQQLLRETGLRSRVRLSTDGGLMTGRDAAIAALLGAEEFVFGTAGLVAEGCVMARQCHKNTCPVGVATQDPGLRDRFQGEPEHVINYFTFIARELRELMAGLGFRSVDEMVGRVEMLRQRPDVTNPKARRVDLSNVLAAPETDHPRRNTTKQAHELEDRLDWSLIEEAQPAITDGEAVSMKRSISNIDRTVGATLANRVVSEHGPEGLPDGTIRAAFDGIAGQSFGAFLASGITFELDGAANDYVGKGLSGGKVILRTPDDAPFEPEDNTLIGNVALYGATGGEVYVEGVAGERFAVRNSGVKAVVEGVGDHGCEYMTGGAVVVLGETGKNFAAGMSGGVAYVYDPDEEFEEKANTDMVSITDELEEKDREMIRRLIENHAVYTDSDRANATLEQWDERIEAFKKVMPDAYAEAIQEYADADVRDQPPAIAGSAAGASDSGVAMSTDD